MDDARTPTWVALAVCAPLVASALVMSVESLALAGDGAYYLVQLIATGEVFGTDQRYLGNVVRQSPVLLALEGGVTSTRILAVLLGIGQIVIPALVWSLAVLYARADRVVFTAVAITAGVCAGTTWFFSVSENVIAVPLTCLVAVLLWRPFEWSRRDAAVALTAALVLVASYETSMVTGLVLAGWAGMRCTRASRGLERYACAAVSTLSALSVLVAVRGGWEQTYPTHSRSLLYFIVELDPWPLYLSVAGLLLFVAGLGGWFGERMRVPLLATGAGALGVAVVGLDMTTRAAFAARGGAGVAGFVLVVLLWWVWARPPERALAPRPTRLLAVPVGFVAAVLAVNVWALQDWSSSLATFRAEVDATRGVAAVDEAIPANERAVLWNWTAPSLSLIVRGDADAGVLVDREPSFVPFDPRDGRRQIPDRHTWRAGG